MSFLEQLFNFLPLMPGPSSAFDINFGNILYIGLKKMDMKYFIVADSYDYILPSAEHESGSYHILKKKRLN